MGEIAEDCYDRAMDELGDMEDAFSGCGPYRGFSQPVRTRALNNQHLSRPQRQLDLQPPVDRDWMFITIEKTWPFSTHNFKVIQPDLAAAVKDFFENEYHKPFRNDKPVPDCRVDVQMQTTGGWIVYGETQTVLIHSR